MTSPVETIADALIAFILSLLRDPDAAESFVASPEAALARHGLEDVCMADVAAVRPVIVDHPHVINQSTPPPPPPAPPVDTHGDGAVREIVRMIQQYTTNIDARSTILDQSVNQNIWTEGGDVTQVFDQAAVVASGDNAVAAGGDATVVDSDVDVTIGDVSVGNETNTGSFNQTGTDGTPDDDVAPDDAPDEAPLPDAATADPATADPDSDVPEAATAAVGTAVDTAVQAGGDTPVVVQEPAPAPPADVPEPADLLESDMTAGGAADSYDADAASAALDDQPVDIPVEDD
ncbi:IniB N-terminal domain-containing protein [Microbacterium sp.]|uniref:IniB N-terminal domain-containing protein n=1 Tax=Microbacterium sp. TaxID=51671 RepID=UPI0028B007E7|nr:IniB N-terminal domain-containing protein [Microbacterium sp.]